MTNVDARKIRPNRVTSYSHINKKVLYASLEFRMLVHSITHRYSATYAYVSGQTGQWRSPIVIEGNSYEEKILPHRNLLVDRGSIDSSAVA